MSYIYENRIQYDSPFGLLNIVKKHKNLIFELAKREITDRYAGQILGPIWMVGHTVIFLAVYIFLFGFVMKSRATHLGQEVDFTAYILAGLVPWLSVADCLNKSSSIITNHAALTKQIDFPLQILPIKSLLVSLTPMLISFPILLIYTLVTAHAVPWTYVLLPFLLIFQVIFMAGLSYMLSAIGVFIRDLKEVVQVVVFVVAYLTPIFYLQESVPSAFRGLLYLNPFSYLIWCYQDLLFYGELQHGFAWIVFAVLSIGFSIFGYTIFIRLKPIFGNSL